ncbi:hypothetical protein SERLA73DRAFT_184420, partial [Serpula lacrymans var. lacrymans S7.3]
VNKLRKTHTVRPSKPTHLIQYCISKGVPVTLLPRSYYHPILFSLCDRKRATKAVASSITSTQWDLTQARSQTPQCLT